MTSRQITNVEAPCLSSGRLQNRGDVRVRKWLEQKARPGVCPHEYPHLFQAESLKRPDDL